MKKHNKQKHYLNLLTFVLLVFKLIQNFKFYTNKNFKMVILRLLKNEYIFLKVSRWKLYQSFEIYLNGNVGF